jgi:hypothetical protein
MVQNNLRAPSLINGVAHAWSNIKIAISGVNVIGISAINYADDQNIENTYGIGAAPVERGFGNITYTADITLLRSEIEAMRASSPTGRLQDIAPFDIIVKFIPVNGQKMVTHIIKDCSIMNDGVSSSQGDLKNEQQINLLPGRIVFDTTKEPLMVNLVL